MSAWLFMAMSMLSKAIEFTSAIVVWGMRGSLLLLPVWMGCTLVQHMFQSPKERDVHTLCACPCFLHLNHLQMFITKCLLVQLNTYLYFFSIIQVKVIFVLVDKSGTELEIWTSLCMWCTCMYVCLIYVCMYMCDGNLELTWLRTMCTMIRN